MPLPDLSHLPVLSPDAAERRLRMASMIATQLDLWTKRPERKEDDDDELPPPLDDEDDTEEEEDK